MKQRLGIAQALLGRPKLLICDEPTSALDPVGRKEILDILSSVKGQTTVLFSTHILSDVERICTDVAFLNNGVVEMQGSLSEIKSRFGREEYHLEVASPDQLATILSAFPAMEKTHESGLIFRTEDVAMAEVLSFMAVENISPLRLWRVEPTLESLFMEVTRV